MKVAIFGGSFNPPHIGHVMAATYAMSIGKLDHVLVVPVYQHAFDKELAPFEDRCDMCELAMCRNFRGIEVSRIESKLETPNRMLRTLTKIKELHPHWELRLLMGTDVQEETDKWLAFDEVKKLAEPFVVGREGHDKVTSTKVRILPEISSTQIREWLNNRTDPVALTHLG